MIQGLIYSILYSIVLIILLPFQYRKRPKEIRGRWLREKFGSVNLSLQTSKSPHPPFSKGGRGGIIWIHAVSVGEVMAVLPFLYKLKEKFPSINLLLSTITDTGQKVAIEKSPSGTKVIYLPFDLKFILNRALKEVKPALFITIETEIWPNLFRTFKNSGIPVIIMNGRISDNSFKGYEKIKFFIKDILKYADLFCMQDSMYAERIKKLGAPEDKVKVMGNFKFDTKPSENIPTWTRLISPPIIIAGSTHRGEEEIIIDAYKNLKIYFPELNLIIAPRHPERFREVEELVNKKGLEYIKRSELISELPNFRASGLIVILDAVGELASVYSIADIAIIGGSFIGHGGQNLLEPAYWSKAIICGPHMENFPFIKEFYDKGAAIEADSSTLLEKLKGLLASPESKRNIGIMAGRLFNEKSGAVDRAISLLRLNFPESIE
jgi:3-deoxy-D-manno-octulosonic-acid transferase